MRCVREQVCLWCGLAGDNIKELRKRLNKELIRSVAQEMQLQQPVRKTRLKGKIKQKPQVAIREPLNPNRIFVKMNGHLGLALIDLGAS